MYRKAIHVKFFVIFISAIFAEPQFVNIQKFRYHGNATKRLLFTVGKERLKPTSETDLFDFMHLQ